MNKHIALSIAVVAALAVVILMFTSLLPWPRTSPTPAPVTQTHSAPATEEMEVYDAPEFGISFEYPSHYMVWEEEVGNAEREHYHIDLVEDTPENRALKAGMSPGREGPTAISFDIYQNDLDKIKLLDWVKGNSASNFKLSDSTYEETRIAGVPAIFYQHTGLYEANAFVFAHRGNVLKSAVTYFSPNDQIVSDFSSVLASLELY